MVKVVIYSQDEDLRKKNPPPAYVGGTGNTPAPATHIWTGGGADNNWTTGKNWNVPLPVSKDADQQYPDLVFPTGAQQLTANNTVAGVVIRSITISGNNYDLTGQPIALGDPAASQSSDLTVNNNTANAIIDMPIALGGPATGLNQQFFTVGAGADVTLNGSLSSTSANAQFTKQGAGTMILTADNSLYTGPFTIDTSGGIVGLQNVNGLGSNTAVGTTVGTNAQLQLQFTGINTISNPLTLNGLGIANDGAILNVSGTNTWSGKIVLDSSPSPFGVFFGTNANTTLTVANTISDLGSGQSLTKVGPGTLVFAVNNTYRGNTSVESASNNFSTNIGSTNINNGFLILQAPLGLGLGRDGNGDGVAIVNSTVPGTGELELQAASAASGFVVLNETVVLNNAGPTGAGSFASVLGNNQWAGSVILCSPTPNNSPVSLGTVAGSTLIISGVISDGINAVGPLSKLDGGEVVFSNHNTYSVGTVVRGGILDIRDSQALGTGSVTVLNGGTLKLEVDSNSPADPHARDLTKDSIVGQTGNGPQLGLRLNNNITLNGLGAGGVGALYSASGINQWTGAINLATAPTGIAVDPDPNPSRDNSYFTHDYSLTVTGVISGRQLEKTGTGQLILATNNAYTGGTLINQGWITIETSSGFASGLGALIPGRGDTAQPVTVVAAGAALMLKPLIGNIDLVANLILTGSGLVNDLVNGSPVPRFDFINQKGALMNLSGDNVVGSDRVWDVSENAFRTFGSWIQVNGVVGIGVEGLGPLPMSNLSVTAAIANQPGSTLGGITKYGSLRLNLQGPGTFDGPVDVREGVLRVQNDTALGQSSSGTNLQSEVFTTTNTTVEPGAGLELATGIAANNGGISAGIQVVNEQMILNGAGVQVAVAGQPGEAFTLSYTDPKNGIVYTTAPLPYGLPAVGGSNTTASVQNALNALLAGAAGAGGITGATVTVTANDNDIYTIVFGGTLSAAKGIDPTKILSGTGTFGNAGTFGTTVTVSGELSPLKNLSNDVATISISEPPVAPLATGGSFTMTFTNPATSISTTTDALPFGLPASGGSGNDASVQNAINALLPAGDSATVTISGNTTTDALATQESSGYRVTFSGSNLVGLDPATFFSATLAKTGGPAVAGAYDVVTFNQASGSVYMAYNALVSPIPSTQPFVFTRASTAQQFQTYLNGLPGIAGAGTTTVSGANGGPFFVNLVGATLSNTLLSVVSGPAQINAPYEFVSFSNPSGLLFMAFNGLEAPASQAFAFAPTTTASQFQAYLTGLPGVPAGAVTVTGVNGGPFFINPVAGFADTLFTVVSGPAQINDVAISVTENQAADNLWRGPVDLVTNSNIDVAYDSRLTLLGTISDNTTALPAIPNSVAAGFTKLGLGELTLAAANTYTGTTNVGQGIMTVENNQALGSPIAGTIVANGATLQLQGNITIGAESLTVQGSGTATPPNSFFPVQWFSTSPGPINNGATPSASTGLPVSGRVTGVATDPSDPNVIYISTAGGGAWKTIDGGKTWHPLFDNTSEVQVTVLGTSGFFSLNINGATTVRLPVLNPDPVTGLASAAQIQTETRLIQDALDNLPTVGGVNGFVNVVVTPIDYVPSTTIITSPPTPSFNGFSFTVVYGGALAQTNPSMMANAVAGLASPPMVSNPARMFTGAIAVAPSDPRIIYLGTGEANGSADSFYGTGVYKSIDSGRTWTLLTDPNPATNFSSDPLLGLAVSKIAVDPLDPDIIYVSTSNEGTSFNVEFSGGAVVTTSLGPNFQEFINSYATDTLDGVVGAVNDRIANTPPTGTFTPIPGVYRFAPHTPPKFGVPVPDTAANTGPWWINLTAPVSAVRSGSDGALLAPPLTPGPDDDFSKVFPRPGLATPNPAAGPSAEVLGTVANWSDIALVYSDQTLYSSVVQPIINEPPALREFDAAGNLQWTLTIYAALGNFSGSFNNAVYRCDNGADLTQLPIWNIGAGDRLTKSIAIEHISITVIPNSAQFNYQLGFPYPALGITKYTPAPFFTDPNLPNAGSGPSTAAQIQAALNSSGILPQGTILVPNGPTPANVYGVALNGYVVTPLTVDYDIVFADANFPNAFTDALEFSPQPLFDTTHAVGLTVTSSIVQQGSGVDTRTQEFPTFEAELNGAVRDPHGFPLPADDPRNGNIKIAAQLPAGSVLFQDIVVAAVVGDIAIFNDPLHINPPDPTNENLDENFGGLDVEYSTTGGAGVIYNPGGLNFVGPTNWVPTLAPLPNLNYTNNNAGYDLALAMDPTNNQHLLVAGYGGRPTRRVASMKQPTEGRPGRRSDLAAATARTRRSMRPISIHGETWFSAPMAASSCFRRAPRRPGTTSMELWE